MENSPDTTPGRRGRHASAAQVEPPTTPTIRRRRPGDLSGCVEALHRVHGRDGYPTTWPDDAPGWLCPPGTAAAWIAVDPRSVGGTDAVLGHVCVIGQVRDPVTASRIGIDPERLAGVSRLFVDPAARGRGLRLGTSLLAAAGEWAHRRRRRLVLDVVDDGGPAIRLYESLGWQLVDRRRADWSTPDGRRLPIRIYVGPASTPGGLGTTSSTVIARSTALPTTGTAGPGDMG